MAVVMDGVKEAMHRWWATAAYIVAIAGIVIVTFLGTSGWQAIGTIVLGALAGAAVFIRVRYPYLLLVVAWAMALVATQMLLVPALLSLGARRRNVVSLVALVLSVGVLAATSSRDERLVSIEGVDLSPAGDLFAWALNAIAVVVVPYLLGVSLNVRRELITSYAHRAAFAEQERAARDREAVLLERQRIASEAHDILGHKLALISMQAGALEVNSHSGSAEVERQAARIGETARDGMVDLRTIIGTLDTPDAQALSPHDLHAIENLVQQSQASGADVALDMDRLDPEGVPEEVGRASYRLVQEALTNAHRHSPGAPVQVLVAGTRADGVSVEVRNHLASPPASPASQSSGRGLPGLRERVRSVGGSFTARVEGDDFIIRAHLPCPPATNKET